MAMTSRGERRGREQDRLADPQWAWSRYEPDEQRPWNLRWAGHLFRRAGFGARWAELRQAVADGPQRSVERLLEPPEETAAFDAEFDDYERATGSLEGLRAWWLRRMLETPHPLQEKMTLFWHHHFGINGDRVNNPRLMMEHVQQLRRHALGNYGRLLAEVSGHPAMLLGLGAAANRKAMPNPQLARHLLERLTLGPGHFSPEEVNEVARAFTGWFVLRGRLRFIAREHDAGVKRILGQEGPWGREDVVRIVLKPPATAEHLVRKLYRWFVSETDEPSAPLLQPLAEQLAGHYDVRPVVETILRSNAFFSPLAYRRRVKSPVEYGVGIVRALEGRVGTERLGQDLAALGQDLYRPPSLDGWPGGTAWLNSATVLGRSNLALALVRGSDPYGDRLDPLAVARRYGHDRPEAAARFLIDLFLQGDLPRTAIERIVGQAAQPGDPSQRVRQAAHHILSLPEFQLA